MSEKTPSIHHLLDRHLEALIERGSRVGSELEDPPTALEVEEKLRSGGFDVRRDVVEYFTWRTPAKGRACLYDETMYLPDIDTAIGINAENAELARTHPEMGDSIGFPGPDYLLPVAYLDGCEYIAIDSRRTGGSLWCCMLSDTVHKCFGSLTEAIETATWCVAAGWWAVVQEDDVSMIEDVSSTR